MSFARRAFPIAAVCGVIVLLPRYFMEGRVGVALAWQVLFFVIAVLFLVVNRLTGVASPTDGP